VSEGLQFEWHGAKAEANLRKHGVSFDEAKSVFADPLSVTVTDLTGPEERLVTIGWSEQQRTLVVVHLEVGNRVRIISARKSTPSELKSYEEGK
jgi:uncharacterized DUF497 family protein